MSAPAASHLGDYAGRLKFCLFLFVMSVMIFFLPFVFFEMPLRIAVNGKIHGVGAPYVEYAAVICAVWLYIAISTILWPGRAGQTKVRAWTHRALWIAFLTFSIVGSATSLAHAFFLTPPDIEEIVHQASFAPALGVVLGLYLFRDVAAAGGPRHAGLMIAALVVVDVGVAIFVPLLLAKVAPAVFSALGILYGMSIMKSYGWRLHVVTLLLVGLIILGLGLKGYMRVVIYGGETFQRRPLAGIQTVPRQSSAPPITGHDSANGGWIVGREIRRIETLLEKESRDSHRIPVRFRPSQGNFRVVWWLAARALERMNRLSDLSYAVEATPRSVPYVAGATYYPLLGKLVPRFIWPTRPPEDAGQFYGHRYGLIEASNLTESYNLPVITEGWINGGWVGIVLSALFEGMLLRFIWSYWIGDAPAPGNILIGMIVVMQAADSESNMSLVIGGAIHGLLMYGLLEEAIRRLGK